MKQFFVITFLLFCISITAQETTLSSIKKENSATVHSLKYTVSSSEELKTIDWNSVKEIFKDNKPEELIELSFEIDLPKSKNKFKSSFTVGGTSKNIDSLIVRIKKGVKSITKLALNYK